MSGIEQIIILCGHMVAKTIPGVRCAAEGVGAEYAGADGAVKDVDTAGGDHGASAPCGVVNNGLAAACNVGTHGEAPEARF